MATLLKSTVLQGRNSHTILGQSYDSLMTTGEITEHLRNLKTYLKTTSYDCLSGVLRQLCPIWIHG